MPKAIRQCSSYNSGFVEIQPRCVLHAKGWTCGRLHPWLTGSATSWGYAMTSPPPHHTGDRESRLPYPVRCRRVC